MLRNALQDVWPLAIALVATLGALAAIVRGLSPRKQWRSLLSLHADESGGVQSLSFVLTVPIFIWLMMLVVQITQVMIATMVVHYAAYAAARSATVWIPAWVSIDEPSNCISSGRVDNVITPQRTGKYE